MSTKNNKLKSSLSSFQKKQQQQQEQADARPVTVVQEVKPKKKIGRPTDKLPNVEYVKLSVNIPETTRDALKIALVTRYKGKHRTQDDLVNSAIMAYIREE